jgi:hypothetical protein
MEGFDEYFINHCSRKHQGATDNSILTMDKREKMLLHSTILSLLQLLMIYKNRVDSFFQGWLVIEMEKNIYSKHIML